MMPRRAARLSIVAASLVVAVLSAATLLRSPVDATARTNVALGRPYRLEPPPNYDRALGRKGTELTDGESASGTFWTNGQTVGWSWQSPVMVEIEFAAAVAIDQVRIQTGANTAVGIRYPSQIVVFGGDAGGRFDLLGSSELHRDLDDTDKAATRWLDIRLPARNVSRLALVVFARDALVYLGEIEAYAAASGTAVSGSIASTDQLRRAAVQHRLAAVEKARIAKPTGPEMARRWAIPLPGASLEEAANDARGGKCEIRRIDPWQTSSDTSQPAPEPSTPLLVALAGGSDYAAWQIVNRSRDQQRIRVFEVGEQEDMAIRTFALANVQAQNLAWVPDAVVPFTEATIPARSAVQLLAQVQPRSAGEYTAALDVVCGELTEQTRVQVLVLSADPRIRPLHGNLWSYLHEASHRPIAKALSCDPDFHVRHGIDSVVVHPAALVDEGRGRPGNLLRTYLRAYRNAGRILLFMDIKSRPWAFLRMGEDRAAASLRDWWIWVEENARAEGVSGELLLYPIDEPQAGDVAMLSRFRAILTRSGITARTYATVDLREIAPKLSWIDVLQSLEPRRHGQQDGSELHLYSTRSDARLLSPQGYYRAQGWLAYKHRLDGIGVWSSWDGTGLDRPETGWSPFGAEERDFGLVYSSPEGCAWPSRRLLAWARGIEDNRILRQCEPRFHGREIDKIVDSPARISAKIAEVAASCVRKAP